MARCGLYATLLQALLKTNSGLLHRMLPGWYDITHQVPSDFHLRSKEDVFDAADKVEAAHRRWEAGALGVTLFNDICKAEGLNYHALALPWRANLRHTIDWFGCFTYDWAHSMLQDGPLNVEVFEYLNACRDVVYFPQVRDWLSLPWIFPSSSRNKGCLLWKIFSEWRQNASGEHDKLHCSASELLGCYKLVQLLLELRVAPDAPDLASKTESFRLCCKAVDIIQAAKKRVIPMREAADFLEATFIAYIAKHKEAYGDANIRPKFHWLFDIIEQFRRDPSVHDQFIIERLHLRIKRPAVKVDNLRRWERSVLAESLNHQVQDLQLLRGPCHVLDNSVMQSDEFPRAFFCKSMRVLGMHLSSGDVVFWQNHVGKIVVCGQEQDLFFIILQLWEQRRVWTDYACTWEATSRRREIVDALEVELACAWRLLYGDIYVVARD